jgi:uncharacterized protein (TIGR01319 family)
MGDLGKEIVGLSDIGLFIDFGSTFTKVTAVDLDEEKVVGVSHATSTVTEDIMVGLQACLEGLKGNNQKLDNSAARIKLGCSSAAGGLRLAVIGLVPNLTVKAAGLAALGAGAKAVGTYSYKLNRYEMLEMEQLSPDIILLSGGTDGGNVETIIHNARMLTRSELNVPVVVAGNKVCADEVKSILELNGRYVKVVENVFPELDKLNVEPARSEIREIFMERIVHVKGLDRAKTFVDSILMPTPMAVLRAAELLSTGAGKENGLGELIVIDIGGATTDVHSIAYGHSTDPGVIKRGLPEPFAKRTVEGDLGIRYNALHILETAGKEQILRNSLRLKLTVDVEDKVRYLSEHIEAVPEEEDDFCLDIGLARTALEIAIERHVGHIEQVLTPTGTIYTQFGKDLTEVKVVIGTGGIFAYGKDPLWVLRGVLFGQENPFSLRPKCPRFFIDKNYILYSIGLLSEIDPEKALRIAKKLLFCEANE